MLQLKFSILCVLDSFILKPKLQEKEKDGLCFAFNEVRFLFPSGISLPPLGCSKKISFQFRVEC